MVGSIVSAPPLEAAVIVPLLVKELPDNVESAAAYRLVDLPLIDDAVACVAGFDLPETALVDGDVRPQGQNSPRAGRVIFLERAGLPGFAEIDRRVVERLRVVEIKNAALPVSLIVPAPVPAALFTTVPLARWTEASDPERSSVPS